MEVLIGLLEPANIGLAVSLAMNVFMGKVLATRETFIHNLIKQNSDQTVAQALENSAAVTERALAVLGTSDAKQANGPDSVADKH